MSLQAGSDPILSLEWRGGNGSWKIACQRRQIFPEEMRNREFLIGVSLRNPKFSNKWLRGIATDIRSLNGRIKLCLVDLPYFSTHCGARNKDAQKRYLFDFRTECAHQEKRIARIADEFPGIVESFRWCDVEQLVPPDIFRELRLAFGLRERVYESLIDQVRLSVKGANGRNELERASLFLQREFPVLIYIYYGLFTDLIDVYPGPQAKFFWDLERGAFLGELPIATRLAQESEGLVYGDVALHGT